MALETAALRRNLSRLELAATVIIIAVLFALFMGRMSAVEGEAERAILVTRFQDMQARLMTLRVEFVGSPGAGEALTMPEVVRHMGRAEIEVVPTIGAVELQGYPPGTWIWAADESVLFYLLINADYLDPDGRLDAAWPGIVRFKLEPAYVDNNDNGWYDEPGDRLTGAILKPLDPQVFEAAGRD